MTSRDPGLSRRPPVAIQRCQNFRLGGAKYVGLVLGHAEWVRGRKVGIKFSPNLHRAPLSFFCYNSTTGHRHFTMFREFQIKPQTSSEAGKEGMHISVTVTLYSSSLLLRKSVQNLGTLCMRKCGYHLIFSQI